MNETGLRNISTESAPAALGAYNQAVRAEQATLTGPLYISGQLGLNPHTGEFVSKGVENQTRQALVNMRAILQAASGSMKDVVKTTVLLRNINDFQRVNRVYAEFFNNNDEPARAAYQVANLPKGAAVEIEAVAYIGIQTSGRIQQFI